MKIPAMAITGIVMLVLSCGDGAVEPPPPPTPMATAVTMSPGSVTLSALGETARFTAEVRDQSGQVMAGAAIAWASSDASVATVDASGAVTAAGNGSATITATAGSASGTAAVTVAQVVTAVAVSPSADTLVAFGDTARLVAEATDANGHAVAAVTEFEWSSSDTAVARVDDAGLVTGVDEGMATITATAGDYSGVAEITTVENPERAALVALYEATDGPSWVDNTNWLNDAPLGEWYGVETDSVGRVTGLDLAGEWDSEAYRPIPHGLAGPIPPELGSLRALEGLHLHLNQLSGSIPSELGNLARLTELSLSENGLTGPIPPGLGNLTALERLFLDDNDLEGAIPLKLGGLSALELLLLQDNRLEGPIPSELGSLAALELLSLEGNDLSGPLPSGIGGMASLREMGLSGNSGLAGPLPAGMTALSRLDALLAGGTDLCAPMDSSFQSWLGQVYRRRIASCSAGLPPMAYLTQAVQSRKFPVPLVAGEKALLRVFPTASHSGGMGLPDVRARFYQNGRETHVAEMRGASAPIPTAVDESSLDKSVNAEIPGHVIQPGLEMVIEVDPEGALDPSLGVAKRIPETGSLEVDVGAMPVFDLTLVPFIWTETGDESIARLVREMAADPGTHELLADTRTLLPIHEIDVTAHAPVLSSSNDTWDLFRKTTAIRAMEGGAGHYMGMMASPKTGPAGIARLPGRSSFAGAGSFVIAHELGHNLNLYHAPCGSAGGPDPSFPYSDGSIGAWGYDFRDGGRLVPPSATDLMAYCSDKWISDYSFTNALRFRLSDADSVGLRSPPMTAPPTKALLLWGGVDADTLPFLEPAFVVAAPPVLPEAGGDYRLSGRSADGRELFGVSFEMPTLADAGGEESSFVFALPVQAGWASLASITLSGPGGSVTMDETTDRPMAILRDPRTGQVRGFLSDLAPETATAADGVGSALGQGLEVLYSRGIPDVGAWRR